MYLGGICPQLSSCFRGFSFMGPLGICRKLVVASEIDARKAPWLKNTTHIYYFSGSMGSGKVAPWGCAGALTSVARSAV